MTVDPRQRVGHGGQMPVRELIPATAIAKRVAELGAEIDARLPPCC